MERTERPEPRVSREEEIRALGFDPEQLTATEQTEILYLRRLFPDETLVN